jgi:MFS family permease
VAVAGQSKPREGLPVSSRHKNLDSSVSLPYLPPTLILLRNRDYRLLFFGFIAIQGGLTFQLVTPIFWVQEHTDDDVRVLLVGVLSAVRGVAMIGFGLYGGTLADRLDRRQLLIMTQSLAVLVSIGVVALVAFAGGGTGALAGLFALVFVASGLWAIDGPTRQSMVPDIVGADAAPRGVALAASGTWLITLVTVLGVGFVIDELGFTGAFVIVAAMQMVALATLLPMRYQRQGLASAPGASGLAEFRGGLRYVWRHPVLRWLIGVSVLMTALAMPAISGLGPTWVTTVVGASFSEFGLIAAFWGLGALAASLVLTRYGKIDSMGLVFAGAALLFAAGFMTFGLKDNAVFAVAGNAGVGAGLIASQIAGVALIGQIVPAELRSRITSLLLLDRALAQFLALPLAAVAQEVGLTTLFPILGVCCFTVVVVLILSARPTVWRTPLTARPDLKTGGTEHS